MHAGLLKPGKAPMWAGLAGLVRMETCGTEARNEEKRISHSSPLGPGPILQSAERVEGATCRVSENALVQLQVSSCHIRPWRLVPARACRLSGYAYCQSFRLPRLVIVTSKITYIMNSFSLAGTEDMTYSLRSITPQLLSPALCADGPSGETVCQSRRGPCAGETGSQGNV